jgi:hypothetical protein
VTKYSLCYVKPTLCRLIGLHPARGNEPKLQWFEGDICIIVTWRLWQKCQSLLMSVNNMQFAIRTTWLRDKQTWNWEENERQSIKKFVKLWDVKNSPPSEMPHPAEGLQYLKVTYDRVEWRNLVFIPPLLHYIRCELAMTPFRIRLHNLRVQ